jgi:hemerythrin-like metal-binding protein
MVNLSCLKNQVETGDDELILKNIDEMFHRINYLNKGSKLDSIIEVLHKYLDRQFNMEEEIMAKTSYPYYLEHLTEHTEFRNQIGELKASIESKISTINAFEPIKNFLYEFLLLHHCDFDKRLVLFLKNTRRKKHRYNDYLI